MTARSARPAWSRCESGCGQLRCVKRAHVLDGALERRDLLRRRARDARPRIRRLLTARSSSSTPSNRCVYARSAASPSRRTVVDDLARAVRGCPRAAPARGAPARRACPAHPAVFQSTMRMAQASIFSTGSTRSALAPAFFRLSSVSQNTFSRHTAWIATLSGSLRAE